jgi:hypothetical protein
LFYVTGDQGHLFINTVFTGNGTEFGHTLTQGVTKIWVFAPDLNDPKSNGYGRGDPDGSPDLLFNFTITLGNVPFEAGDKFEIDIEYVTGNNSISFTSASGVETGKGYVSNIVADAGLMYVDGAKLSIGDHVLVTAQNNAWENGVYTVRPGKWIRTPVFFDKKEYLPQGSIFYITSGVTHAANTWTLSSRAPDTTFILDDPVHGGMTFVLSSTSARPLVSDWQVVNFWAHRDTLMAAGTLDSAIQATRPIIEYFDQLQLNSKVDSNGFPSNTGTSFTQSKTAFNQIPQFDLFYYDGTHAKKTSGIFFYAEDPDFPIDTELQRRLKTTVNSDFIFGTGIQDEEGRLLFFKQGSELKTIWAEGVIEPYAYFLD